MLGPSPTFNEVLKWANNDNATHTEFRFVRCFQLKHGQAFKYQRVQSPTVNEMQRALRSLFDKKNIDLLEEGIAFGNELHTCATVPHMHLTTLCVMCTACDVFWTQSFTRKTVSVDALQACEVVTSVHLATICEIQLNALCMRYLKQVIPFFNIL